MGKQDFRALSRLDQDYNILMSSMHVSVSKNLMDEYFTVIWANDAFYESTLYTKEEYEAIYRNKYSVYFQQDPEEYAKFAGAITRAVAEGQPGYESICRMPQKGGSHIWIKIVGTFTDEKINGIPVIYSTFTDVSDAIRMQMEQSVTYDNIPGFIAKYRVGRDGFSLVEANKRFIDFFGLDERAAGGHPAFSMLGESGREALNAHKDAMRRGEHVHFVVKAKDWKGRDAWLQLNGDCVAWEGGDPVYLMVYIDITDITEQKELQRRLEERTAQLGDALALAERANQAKSDFLARMSHDLRTPINAIVGMTAIAGAHVDDRARVLDCLQKITGSSKLLLGLINEVLDMSKIESGRLMLSEDAYSLGEAVQDLVVMMQPDIRQRKHSLDVRVVGVRHEAVTGDSQRIQQVLMNILSNAVKYTPEGGRLLIEIREKAARDGSADYEFVFEDNGRGMKPDFLERIFKPFEREEDQEIRSIQGTGLGMAISHSIIQLMGGDIKVESTFGRGSRFTVRIPLRLREQESGGGEELAGLSVLVADDDEIVCRSTCECLREIGIEGQWVVSGPQAVEAALRRHAQAQDFFAVILDLKMPEIDGIETARRIRAAVGREVPIILLSAYDLEIYETEAREAGVNGFISKPLFKSKLVSTLKKYVRQEGPPAEPAPIRLSQADYSGRRVLLVEDNELNLEIAEELVGSTGAEVETALDGESAVDKVAGSPEGRYDLIFMDVQMPGIDGYEATRRIRGLAREDVKSLPIVAMTANAFSEDARKALEAGMNAHLPKPIDLKQLTALFAEYL